MPGINIVSETEIAKTPRVRQLEAMFDAPVEDILRLTWQGDLPIDDFDWNVGLIVGPSGSGKSTIARNVFAPPVEFDWASKSVIDDFPAGYSIEQIAAICQAVGFNTIPAWCRPYRVLSTGEQFRVDLARRMLTLPDPIVVDEFTSVVDRQIAQIGSHAVQKYMRKNNRRFIAVSCHYDIIDWLQPDWTFEPATMSFTRRSLCPRPAIQIEIRKVGYEYWRLFAPFHYLTNNLHRGAQCFVLFANGRPASFGGMLHRPHPKVRDIMGLSRLVTLPDWQGLGLAMVLSDTLGAAYRAIGKRMHVYPAHPALVRSYDKSEKWHMEKRPGTYSPPSGNRTNAAPGESVNAASVFGGRPCAVFEYIGEGMASEVAAQLLTGSHVE